MGPNALLPEQLNQSSVSHRMASGITENAEPAIQGCGRQFLLLCQRIILSQADYERLTDHRLNMKSFSIYRKGQQCGINRSVCELLQNILDISTYWIDLSSWKEASISSTYGSDYVGFNKRSEPQCKRTRRSLLQRLHRFDEVFS